MLVKLHADRGLVVDAEVSVTATAPVGGSLGGATITINRLSPAWTPEVLSSRKRMLVEIFTPRGRWRGITDGRPRFDGRGVTLEALSLNAALEIRLVSSSRSFYSATAGMIAKAAVRDAFGGLDTLSITPGTFLHAPPTIPVYHFAGQPLLNVLIELAEQSGQEWFVDDALRLNWVSKQGRYQQLVVVDDGRLFETVQIEIGDVAEVIEVEPDGRKWTARVREASRLWPKQEVVST